MATPPTAVTVVVPSSGRPPGFTPSSMVTSPVKLDARFPSASSARTLTAGLKIVPPVIVPGCWPNTSCDAAPGVILKTLLVARFSPVAVAVSQ